MKYGRERREKIITSQKQGRIFGVNVKNLELPPKFIKYGRKSVKNSNEIMSKTSGTGRKSYSRIKI
jgi:hypothetical protein